MVAASERDGKPVVAASERDGNPVVAASDRDGKPVVAADDRLTTEAAAGRAAPEEAVAVVTRLVVAT